MRTLYPVMFVLALGTAGLMFQMSGIGAVMGPSPSEGLGAPGELQDQANQSAVGGNASEFQGSASTSNDGDLVGLILNGGQAIMSLAGMVVMLPFELRDMGFPAWFAFSIGPITQLVVSIGVIQFTTNRDWR